MAKLRRYILAGLIVWLPLLATYFVVRAFVNLLDKTIQVIPASYRPEAWLGFDIPGLGVMIAIIVVIATGALVSNYIGRYFVGIGESLLRRIPLVRTIYSAVKQILETVFSQKSQAFRKVILIEYPRKGLWSIAFQTAAGRNRINDQIDDDVIMAFVPTTPNPTSGFLIMVPKQDAIELTLTVDEALKTVISLGVMQPGTKEAKLKTFDNQS